MPTPRSYAPLAGPTLGGDMEYQISEDPLFDASLHEVEHQGVHEIRLSVDGLKWQLARSPLGEWVAEGVYCVSLEYGSVYVHIFFQRIEPEGPLPGKIVLLSARLGGDPEN